MHPEHRADPTEPVGPDRIDAGSNDPESTRRGQDDPGPADAIREVAAPHVGRGFRELRQVSRDTVVTPGGPHHLAHFSGGVFDFGVDSLDRSATASADADRARDQAVRVGRQLSLLFGGLDESLQVVRSGALIRLVLHGGAGACFADSIVPRQLMVGTRIEPAGADGATAAGLPMVPGVRGADVAMAELVTAVRATLSEGPQNPGGFGTEPKTEPPFAPTLLSGFAAPERRHVDDLARTALTRDFVRSCAHLVSPADLHYLALCQDAEILATMDDLEDDHLDRYFSQISAGARRSAYADLGRGLCFLAGRLGRMSAPIIGGPLLRVVLDVQQGAIYYYRLRAGGYVVGVTLDQSRVSVADNRMATVALTCQKLLESETGESGSGNHPSI